MRFGVNTWVWESSSSVETIEDLAELSAEIGFDILELPLEQLALDYSKVSRITRSEGLSISTAAVMTPERDLVHEDEEKRENAMNYLRGAIDATGELGGSNLVGPIYSSTGRLWSMTPEERENKIQDLVEKLRILSDYAAKNGVTLCIEPLNRFETSLINTTEQGCELVDRIDHSACKLLLDTFHMNIEEKDIPSMIRYADDRVGHIHACANDRGTPGTGHIPWESVGGALEDIGYDGPVVIESFTPSVASIAKAAAIWRPLAPDQDTIAREGLSALQGTLGTE